MRVQGRYPGGGGWGRGAPTTFPKIKKENGMLGVMVERLRQKYRTVGYPDKPAVLPDRYRGLPELRPERCADGCVACLGACPTGALFKDAQGIGLDLGRCLFCGACAQACGAGAISFGREFRLAARRREDLVLRGPSQPKPIALEPERARLFSRSLRLRQVSAGGCNACEADINVLGTIVFDLGRFGIDFVASPRHADGLAVTGPVTRNMREALLRTYEATPDPKVVIAVGSCAVSGGIYADSSETNNGIGDLLPVDLYIPGCPPHPLTILEGFLGLLGRVAR